MRFALRIATFLVGIIGAIDGIIINAIVSSVHAAASLLGADVVQSHGWIGLLLCLLALVGAFVALRWPIAAGVLFVIAGVGFFFVVHWWALLASPQILVAALTAFLDSSEATHTGLQRAGERLTAPGAPRLPQAS